MGISKARVWPSRTADGLGGTDLRADRRGELRSTGSRVSADRQWPFDEINVMRSHQDQSEQLVDQVVRSATCGPRSVHSGAVERGMTTRRRSTGTEGLDQQSINLEC